MAAIAATSRKPAPRERRASPRRRLCLEAQADLSPGSSTPVVIHNLSQSGFVMEATGSPSIGADIQLRLLDGDPVPAQVVWRCGRHFGCEFERLLPSAMVSAALLKSRRPTAAEVLPRRIHFDPPAVKAAVSHVTTHSPVTGLGLALAFSTLLWAMAGALIL